MGQILLLLGFTQRTRRSFPAVTDTLCPSSADVAGAAAEAQE